VYGSLLSGLHNHYLLTSSTLIRSSVRTRAASFALVDGTHGFPYAIDATPPCSDKSLKGDRLVGELYTVSATTLDDLDELEGHPTFYRRRLVSIDGEEEPAWVFILEDEDLQKQICEAPEVYHAVPDNDWRSYLTAARAR